MWRLPRLCNWLCARLLCKGRRNGGGKTKARARSVSEFLEWLFGRHPFRACSPNQSPLERVVTATWSSLGEPCWETFTCTYHKKKQNSFSFVKRLSSLFPLLFSYFFTLAGKMCLITFLMCANHSATVQQQPQQQLAAIFTDIIFSECKLNELRLVWGY